MSVTLMTSSAKFTLAEDRPPAQLQRSTLNRFDTSSGQVWSHLQYDIGGKCHR